MAFVDETSITVSGGKGGDGVISWHRERFKPLGGPDGGRGGAGGAVVFLATSSESSLNDIAFKGRFSAQDGKPGQKGRKDGKDGENLILQVPVGTQFFYEEELVADLQEESQAWLAVRGGRGGRGNSFFVSSKRQAPRIAEQGQAGQSIDLSLKLKHIADVGLVGLPNSGKSTLLRAMSKAKPKVGDYPFTTLSPELGVVDGSFKAADIPGLIKDAHLGKGLGIGFLKHIERTKTIVYVLESTSVIQEDPLSMLETELSAYSDTLSEKPKIIFISKCDLVDDITVIENLIQDYRSQGYKVLLGSSVNMQGIEELKLEIQKSLVNEAA